MNYWTAEEDEFLERWYDSEPLGELLAVLGPLGRTLDAVRNRAKALGLRKAPAWSEAQTARLRAAWGRVPTRQLATELGKTPGAVKQRALILGLDSGRDYTPEEIALVRELYPTHTAAQVAARLPGRPRSAKAVWRLAVRLGLKKWPSWAPEVLERVRALHAGGLCDREIAGRMAGVFAPGPRGRDQVKHVRQDRLRLPRIPDADARRRSVANQLRTLGVGNTGELRALAYRKYARENGWPEDCRPREVQILNVLAAAGVPMTRLEISRAIGMRTDLVGSNGSPTLLMGNGPGGTYTASLARRGLLTRLPGAAGPAGRTRGCRDLYCLGPAALEVLRRRAEAAAGGEAG